MLMVAMTRFTADYLSISVMLMTRMVLDFDGQAYVPLIDLKP